MSDPIVDPSELATYFDDEDDYNENRAELMIELAQAECERVTFPLPESARNVVIRVAHRGYLTTRSPRQYQKDQAGYDVPSDTLGGIYLTPRDEQDLRGFGSTTSAVYSVPFGAPWNTVDLYR